MNSSNGLLRARSRPALSLVEVMIYTVIGLMILTVIWGLAGRGMSLQDATAKGIDMMVQARTIVEYFSRDVRSAMMFMPPLESEDEVVLIRDPSDVDLERITLGPNDFRNSAYPYYDPSGETVQAVPAIRVRYLWNRRERTLTRIKEDGILSMKDDARKRGFVCNYAFRSSGRKKQKVLGTDVTLFKVVHIAIDRRGKPRRISRLVPADFYLDSWVGDQRQIRYAETALVWLDLVTRFDKGLYGSDAPNAPSGKDRKAEEVHIATKIVCLKKAIDSTEREWFSSFDSDMRY